MNNNNIIPSDNNQPQTQSGNDHSNGHQQAAENIVRGQIDQIYDKNPPNQLANQEQKTDNPYNRNHQQNFDWSKYHSAWQQYYQQYYQRYYWQQLHTERQKIAAQQPPTAQQIEQAEQPKNQIITGKDEVAEEANKSQVKKLKEDITNQVKERATKLRRSHHFVPIVSAVAVGLLFLFLQFNNALVAQVKAYVSPGAISEDALTIDPTAPIKVSNEPRLIIPKINVDVPVDYNTKTLNEAEIQQSLKDGTTHYKLPGADAVPGQYGNAVFLGHSSNDIFNQGEYKFVFVLLDRLVPGDVYYAHYQGKRYTYRVTETKVIDPKDIKALRVGNDKPMSTLITCTPPGTALQRLIVFGEQISPDPTEASKPDPGSAPSDEDVALPDDGKSILEQIWGFFF